MIIITLVILGLSFGSFVNALVWRVHENETSKKKSKKLSITKGRSMCVDCKHELAPRDLVPVLSWVSLRGKCRYCHKNISWQYPFVELITAILFVFSYIYWPYGFETAGFIQFVFWLVFLIGFLALSIYDLRWIILPNRIVYPLIIFSVILVLCLSVVTNSFEPITRGLYGVLVSSGLFYLLFQLSDGKWIGGGDVKLGVIIGLILGGPLQSILMLFIASSMGSLVSIPLLLSGNGRNKRIPFGPFLMAATVIVYLFGESITNWYQTTFLLL